ncbi:MaoC/PaaZ C-terminal domain-containing protein, partial [Corynebacterium frankenforstense]|uniref:MaoC/PaaZ C-terminal domain-containing protein n=1 Tax=Corynebacterium frankenforstense TaxID=1230998 RepID=UPI0026F06E86
MAAATNGYTKLAAVPDLMGEYRAALGGLVPGLGALQKGSGSSGSGSGSGAREIPAERFEVHGVVPDTTHLAEYCRTTGLRFGEELPATYPYVLAFPLAIKVMNSKGFPFGAVGVVHLTNAIEQTRPLHVGEALDIRVRAENPRAHRAGMLIDMVTEVTIPAEGDEVVWRQVSGFLGKGAKTEGLPAAADSAVKAAGEPAANPAFVRVTQDTISAYAEASGDKNPIHVSKVGAKAFGFPSTIAHGMWSAAAMLAGMEGLVPEAARFEVEFG